MGHPTKDEYNWQVYTEEYSAQVDEMERTAGPNGSDFLIKNFTVNDDGIEFHDNLHGNWKQLYSTLYSCQPNSVFECGCGGMYHLKNVRKILPEVEIGGCDLLQTQIDFGRKKFDVPDDIMKNVSVRDFTQPDATEGLSQYDFVYSHAVILHLSHDNAVKFLKNMTKIAKKNIFFIEGPQHNYFELLKLTGEDENFDIEKLEGGNKNAFLLHRK
jgi:2-polyprenyl-3-methyl-5-hydroxy-6-metoxy-1,4-benzoquinol methylase